MRTAESVWPKLRQLVRGMACATLCMALAGASGLAHAAPQAASKAAVKPKAGADARGQVASKKAVGGAKSVKSAKSAKSVKSANSSKGTKSAKSRAKLSQQKKRRVAQRRAPPRPSFGQLYGLRATEDALDLHSSVALVVDSETDEVLFSKNPDAVLPIASITKLMTALVVTEAQLPLDEKLLVTREDAAVRAGSRSRLVAGARLSRGEMLHLALMASENRAAYLLGRTYPGGMAAFVEAMNAKAQLLGMHDTRYVEPTGLSSDNQSSAHDLALLVRAAGEHAILRELSTSPQVVKSVGRRQVEFRNTNGLVRNPEWEIDLQKTGYISAAGRCVVLQTQLAGRQLIMVLLDSAGKYSRIGDAERLRKWLTETRLLPQLPALGLADALTSLPKPLGWASRISLPDLPDLPAWPGIAGAPLAQGVSGALDPVR